MLEFIIIVILVYIFYYLFVVRKYDEKGNYLGKKKNKQLPPEVDLLIYRYNIDYKKLNFRALLKLIALTVSIDIAIIFTAVIYSPFKKPWQMVIGGMILTVPIILISYSILGAYFKKKGLTKNGKK